MGFMDFASPLLGGISSFVGAAKSRTAARRAGEAEQTGFQNALNLQREQFDVSRDALTGAETQARADLQPFQTFGVNAISPLQNLLSGGGDIGAFLEGTPGFQASLEGGVRAIDASASNAGLIGSGARAKELSRFGSDLATQTLNQERNALFRAADIGRGTATDLARVGTGTANVLSNRSSAFAAAGGQLLSNKGISKANTIAQRNTAFQQGLTGVTEAAGNVLGTFAGLG